VLGPITVPEYKYRHLEPSRWNIAAFQGTAVLGSYGSSLMSPQLSPEMQKQREYKINLLNQIYQYHLYKT